MKSTSLTLLVLAGLMLSSIHLKAQEKFTSWGVELAQPLDDFNDAFSFGFGLSAQYESGISSKFAITAKIGFISLNLNGDLDEEIKSVTFVPIQFGGKYY